MIRSRGEFQLRMGLTHRIPALARSHRDRERRDRRQSVRTVIEFLVGADVDPEPVEDLPELGPYNHGWGRGLGGSLVCIWCIKGPSGAGKTEIPDEWLP